MTTLLVVAVELLQDLSTVITVFFSAATEADACQAMVHCGRQRVTVEPGAPQSTC